MLRQTGKGLMRTRPQIPLFRVPITTSITILKGDGDGDGTVDGNGKNAKELDGSADSKTQMVCTSYSNHFLVPIHSQRFLVAE